MTKEVSALALGAPRETPAPPGLRAPRSLHARLVSPAGLDDPALKPRAAAQRAGTHLLIDMWDATRLDELDHIEATMRSSVEICGATLLHLHLHHFTPTYGVTGVAVLAESHISIHTWPEHGYAALDIFMCGDAEPARAVPGLQAAFRPGRIEVETIYRGTGLPA